MKAFVACIALALVACASAEPPSGYNYNRPSGGISGGFSGLSGGGSYRAVSSGYQTSEGQNVDPQLLEQVRQILLKEEASSSSGSGFGASAPSSSYGVPSSSYGVPSSSYGVPSGGRVVGINLEGVRQAIQVAQYEQSGGSSGGYPSGPSSSYGAPARAPSSSYGAPLLNPNPNECSLFGLSRNISGSSNILTNGQIATYNVGGVSRPTHPGQRLRLCTHTGYPAVSQS